MTLTPEQEQEWRAQLEHAGVSNVREDVKQGRIQSAYYNLTSRWLADKEREENSRKDADVAEQREQARRASDAATRASDAAERAADAAERQATAAERANTRATIALVIAIISAMITIIGIAVAHLDIK